MLSWLPERVFGAPTGLPTGRGVRVRVRCSEGQDRRLDRASGLERDCRSLCMPALGCRRVQRPMVHEFLMVRRVCVALMVLTETVLQPSRALRVQARAALLALLLGTVAGVAQGAAAPGTLVANTAVADFVIAGQTLSVSDSAVFAVAPLVGSPPTEIGLSATSLPSGTAGAVVGTVTVTDSDPSDTHALAVDDARFQIVDAVLQLRPGLAIDAALEPTVTVAITAVDSFGLSFTETLVLTILAEPPDPPAPAPLTISPTVCSAPDARSAPATLQGASSDLVSSVCENVAGAAVAKLGLAGGSFGLEISDPRFEVTASGLVKLRADQMLDFETEPTVDLVARVLDGATLVQTFEITVRVKDRNEPPAIGVGPLEVLENVPGAVVGPIDVEDPDVGDVLTVTVDDPRFEVVGGELRLRAGIAVDNGEEPLIPLVLRVTDEGGVSADAVVQLQVINVNDPPEAQPLVTGVAVGAAAGTLIDRVEARDPDADDTLSFEIVSGNDDGAFAIDAGDGGLRVANPAALGPDGSIFELVVRVTDDNSSGSATGPLSAGVPVRITVTGSNTPPFVQDQQFEAVREDVPVGTLVGVVGAVDEDQPLRYRIVSGDRDNRFSVDAATGEVRVAARLDFETQQRFDLEIAVSDSHPVPLTSLAVLRIDLMDVNEAPVVDAATFVISATAARGIDVGTVRASDPDTVAGDRATLVFVSGNEAGAFEIDPPSGLIKVVNLAALGPAMARTLKLVVRAVDMNAPGDPVGNLNTDATITIGLVLDNGPPTAINLDNLRVEAGVTGALVGSVTVADPDPEDVHEFLLSDPRFEIVDRQLRLVAGASLAAEEVVRLSITATDLLGQSVTRVFPIDTGTLVRSPSAIEFLRSPAALQVATFGAAQLATTRLRQFSVGQSQCSVADSLAGPFIDTPAPTSLGNQPLSVPGSVGLENVRAYKVGEPIFVRLIDADANLDPAVIDAVVVVLAVDGSRDREIVRLRETDVDSGEFVGHVQSTTRPGGPFDCLLWVANDVTITAAYFDAGDGTDTAATAALVDPFGLVFEAGSGRPVDGARVRLIDAATGQPARVLGDEPFADYPSEVESGGQATDAAGVIYDFADGSYRFPFVAPGRYRLEVDAPNRFRFPSTASDADLAVLPDGPFNIVAGSRGEVFEVPLGPAVRIDLPVDIAALVPTPSRLRVLTLAAPGSAGESVRVERTRCRAAGATLLDLPRDAAGALIELPAQLQLRETTVFASGATFFVELTDPDQDRDPFAPDTVIVTFAVPGAGELETIELRETGRSTGVFTGYLASADATSVAGDCRIGAGPDTRIDVAYADIDDSADRSAVIVAVDPSARVFDAGTGTLLDDVAVTLVDALSGEPARPLAADGVTPFPATVRTGERITLADGSVVDLPAGRFRFPQVPPGEYRYEIEAPAGFRFPSQAVDAQLQQLDGAPFLLDAGSRGEPFTVAAGSGDLRDVPLDPSSAELFLTKVALDDVVAIGDFVQYEITVQNAGSSDAGAVMLLDTLPHGFRFQRGSARLEGELLATISVGDDGRSLGLTLPPMALGETLRVRYVAEVAAGARPGEAINRVTGSGPGVRSSNTAEASVIVREDLLRSKAILIGRVLEGACDAPATERRGLAGVRLYMEDGTNVITDAAGRWHIEGVEPGGHVVQLDLTSLPGSHRIMPCEDTTRFAGTPFSQFVDLQGGSLWRADFHVALKPPMEEDVLTRLQARVDGDRVLFALEAEGREVPLTDLSLVTILPQGLQFEAGSARRNGEPVDDPAGASGAALTFRLGDTHGAWRERLTFSARITPQLASGRSEVRSMATFGTPSQPRVRSQLATTELLASGDEVADPDALVIDPNTDMDCTAALLDRLLAGAREQGRTVTVRTDGPAAPWVAEIAARHEVEVSGPGGNRLQGPAACSVSRNVAGGAADGAAGMIWIVREREAPAAQTVTLARADSGLLRTRAVGEVPGLAEDRGWQRRQLPDQLPPEWNPTNVGTRADGPAILWPARDFLPRITSTWFVIRHGLDDKVALTLNDQPVSPLNFDGRTRFSAQGVALSVWRGVDIERGRNVFAATITQADGAIRTLVREVDFSGPAARGEVVPEASVLVADGTTVPEVAIRFHDRRGARVRPGMTGEYRVLEPYRAFDERREEVDISLDRGLDRNNYVVNKDGIAWIPLEPTSRAGEVRIVVDFGEQGSDEFRARLAPAAREWILVGFGEGSVGYETLSRNRVSARDAGHDDGLELDGRVALFAKGMIQGKWLLTMAYDSDKERERRIGRQIDPDRFYSLYGDGSQQQFDAESGEKLYLKIERSGFSALFGDYDTVLGGGELTRFARRLTGARSEYADERWDVVVFGAESTNAFLRDELRGDGTSGLYRLSGERILVNGERITIETRDRFRDDEILASQTLTRHLDYNIDYDSGTILFKDPVPSQDEALNPVFIVAEYETEGRGDGRRDLIAGGRVARHLAGDAAEVGVSVIHDGTRGAEATLAGIDAEWRLDSSTRLTAEAAWSEGLDKLDQERQGLAWQLEAERRGEIVRTRAYYREQEADFGVGQQNASQSGTRRFGLIAEARMSDALRVDSEAWQQRQLETGAQRNVVETEASWRFTDSTRVGVGGRSIRERDADGDEVDTQQATARIEQALFDGRGRMHGLFERALGGTDSRDFPTRALLGAEFDVFDRFTLLGTQEFTFGGGADGERDTQDTHVGARARPWEGAALDAGVTERFSENGERLFANVGLTQSLRLGERWQFDFGFDREQTFESLSALPAGQVIPDDRDADPFDAGLILQDPRGLNPARPPASGAAADGDFSSGFLGAAYRHDSWQATARAEVRHADLADKLNLRAGLARQLDEGRIFSLTVDYLASDGVAENSVNGSARLALAWRPQAGAWTFLDRLDLVFAERTGASIDFVERKLVNNFNASFRPDARNQLALQFGMKYVLDDIDGDDYSAFTTLLGAEYRHDVTARWDVGLHLNMLSSWNASVMDYRSGVSIGHTPFGNTWVSVGYNFDGFRDGDFEGADFMARGPFLRFRLKVDQASLQDYLGELPFSLR